MRVTRAMVMLLAGIVPAAVAMGMMATGSVRLDAAAPTGTGPRPDGRAIFRYDTFGDEQLWTGVLRMHDVVGGVSPATALGVGLKVDVDALPAGVVNALRAGQVDVNDPAVTRALLSLDAVVGLKATVSPDDTVTSVGVTCALCHSTVDNSLAPGIGHRLDGWANLDLNVGAIVSLSPALDDATRTTVLAWGPGRYDPRHHIFDGTNIVPLHATSVPVVIPSIYGLRGTGFETFTADGPISYWNSYVGVTQMGGHGTFNDARLGIAVSQTPDLVTSRLPALLDYQLSLRTPKAPKGSVNRAAADRGEALFEGQARCSTCHMRPNFTDVLSGPTPAVPLVHDAAETGMDPAYAQRTATGKYRTTPLRGLWQHAPYFHDGSAPTLADVVEHYDTFFSLGLSPAQKRDLVEYLKTL